MAGPAWELFVMGPQFSHSYGPNLGGVQRLAVWALLLLSCVAVPTDVVKAAEQSVNIVVLGDSLTAGLGLQVEDAFPAKLTKALKSKGVAATIANAGVSGDTASGGLGRLDWSVPVGTEAVIVELGGNDALRGLDPSLTTTALDATLRKLAARRVAVLLAGMRAPPNMGPEYAQDFDAIYPALASTHP